MLLQSVAEIHQKVSSGDLAAEWRPGHRVDVLSFGSGWKFQFERTGQGWPPSRWWARPEPNLGEDLTDLAGLVGDRDQAHPALASLAGQDVNTRRSNHAQGCLELRLASTSTSTALRGSALGVHADRHAAEPLVLAFGQGGERIFRTQAAAHSQGLRRLRLEDS